jgi:Uma2 family endonuclease
MSIAMEKSPHRGRITVDEYHRMAEVGLLARDARVELIEGVIVEMPPMGPRHAGAVRRLTNCWSTQWVIALPLVANCPWS